MKLVGRRKEHQDMGVRKPTLLPLHAHNMGSTAPKFSILDVLQELAEFLTEQSTGSTVPNTVPTLTMVSQPFAIYLKMVTDHIVSL